MYTKTDLNHFSVIPNEILFSDDLNSTQKVVYQVVYTMINNKNDFYMSNSKFAKKLGMTSSSVSKAVTFLKNHHLVKTFNVTDDGVTQYRYITLDHGGENIHGGGENIQEPSENIHPNILSNKLKTRESRPKSENSNQRPKIIQTVIGYFPTLQTYYKREMLCDSVDDWLKHYTPEQIFNAIDSAQDYQMKVRRVGAPVRFLTSTLERQVRKAKKQERKRRDAEPNVDQLIAQTKQNDAAEEKTIVENAKKKGLI